MDPVTLGMAKAAAKREYDHGLKSMYPRLMTPVVDHTGVPGCEGNIASGANLFAATRIQHKVLVAGGFTVLVAQFVNWYANGFNGEIDGPNDITVSAAWELGDGTKVPMTINGKRKYTLKPGESAWSDPSFISHKGTADTYAHVWTRTVVEVASLGQKWPWTLSANNTARPGEGISQSNTAPGFDYTTTGTISATDSFGYGPVAILGNTPTRTPIAAAVGDSIAWGAMDTNVDGGGGFNGHGFISKALLTAKIPYNRVANPGDRLSRWTQPLYSYRRYNWLPGVKNVIHEYGVNDIEGGAATQDLTQTNMVKSWKMIADMGCDVWQTTLTPFTTTTDNWATEANQTVSTKHAVRVAVNTWIRDGGPLDPVTKLHVAAGTSGALRAGQAGHPIKGYIEIADTVETARNSGKWKTTGSAFGYTGDGVHPNGRGTTLMAAALTAKLPAMGH